MELINKILENYQGTEFILGFCFLLLVLIYLVAFFLGRELSFWPPKIGPAISKVNIGQWATSDEVELLNKRIFKLEQDLLERKMERASPISPDLDSLTRFVKAIQSGQHE